VKPDRKDGNPRKPPRTPVAITPSGELTCSEGQVEDLLSEGESTEKRLPAFGNNPRRNRFLGTSLRANPLRRSPHHQISPLTPSVVIG
jgi:hypothetical protein